MLVKTTKVSSSESPFIKNVVKIFLFSNPVKVSDFISSKAFSSKDLNLNFFINIAFGLSELIFSLGKKAIIYDFSVFKENIS